MTNRIIALVFILPAIIVNAVFYFYIYNFASIPKACPLPDYVSYSGHTEDLLILEGPCVVPTAVKAIENREIPKRSFIISFLGNGGYREALETLLKIVEDETDTDRASALIATFQIDNEKGVELAKKYENQQDELGKYSRDILANKNYLQERTTYWEAWRNYVEATYAL